jgi:hypothetical protein
MSDWRPSRPWSTLTAMQHFLVEGNHLIVSSNWLRFTARSVLALCQRSCRRSSSSSAHLAFNFFLHIDEESLDDESCLLFLGPFKNNTPPELDTFHSIIFPKFFGLRKDHSLV